MLRASAAVLLTTLSEARAPVETLHRTAVANRSNTPLAVGASTWLKHLDSPPLQDFDRQFETLLNNRKDVFPYLGTQDFPLPARLPDEEGRTAMQDERLIAVRSGLDQRLPEAVLGPVVRKVKPDTLSKAIRAAELQSKAHEDTSQPYEARIAEIVDGVLGPVQQAARLHHLVILGKASLPKEEQAEPQLREAVVALAASSLQVTAAADDLDRLVRAAQSDYHVRRYRVEEACNRETALLYEVQVFRSSVESGIHIRRSSLFFYGMLLAQAAVAISTFALAARKKGVLWALGATAGLIAVSFSAYLFLSF
jgi:hypothetical protein